MTQFNPLCLLPIFPLFFVGLWLVVTGLLGLLSGWFVLMKRFPDQEGAPLITLAGQSGSMGVGVNMRGVLTLAACEQGLRVSINRFLGPFSRPFLAPWGELNVGSEKVLFGTMTRLQFAAPPVGVLLIADRTAQRLANASGGKWPVAAPGASRDAG